MKLILLLSLLYSSFAFSMSLKQSLSFDLPGPVGKRFDYLKMDYQNHRLFLAHLGADQVYVIDSNTGKLITTIPDTPGVEGIEYVSEFQKIYTSNWKDHTVGVVDLKTMKVAKKLPEPVLILAAGLVGIILRGNL